MYITIQEKLNQKLPRKKKKALKKKLTSRVLWFDFELFKAQQEWLDERMKYFPLGAEQVRTWQQRSEGKLPERVGYH
jgi:DNA recombination-dependent growth factor C